MIKYSSSRSSSQWTRLASIPGWAAAGLLLSAFLVSGNTLLAAEELPQTALTETGTRDPLIKVNRGIYTFNTAIDNRMLKPVARGYERVTPGSMSHGVTNFFQNLDEPRVMLNSILQGKIDRAGISLARFIINTTFGIGGVMDVAKASGAPYQNEDFGQTMAVWGWENGSYIMLPFLGPSNVRDTLGEVVDFFTYPLLYYHDAPIRNGLYVLRFIDHRANLLSATDIVDEAGGEQDYEFIREAYEQRRKSQIHDGAPPLEGLEFLKD